MTPRTLRRAERVAHLFWGLAIAGYVYGLLPAWGEPFVRWVVIPGVAASGLAMWFAAPIRRLARRILSFDRPYERTVGASSEHRRERRGAEAG